ncbi:hypothetical protein BC938DRAFT_477302 [Jimgerdemannia flammicorona]|uniref:Hemerythrin-like domain-containing protein n=1 Tax=Jimgerdemannia flammicorona TaxID=994334 RepID=A0A433QPH6_9FUNG|nr:hypothetical protein BC938DRAFT_477302 [Jimgerdemannia flammicorona]
MYPLSLYIRNTRNLAAFETTTALDPEDVTVLIKGDHDSVRDLYNRYKILTKKPRFAMKSSEKIVVYPVIEKEFDGGKSLAEKSRNEHQVVKDLLYEIDNMSQDDPAFNGKLSFCFSEFDHHSTEEEQQHLPHLRKTLTNDKRQELGREYNKTKKFFPTR